MISALRPAGALLAALALWALGLLLLAVAGLGAQVGLHPPNAALMPPMPVVQLDVIGSRLGPATDYLEVGNRPLLSPDRQPAPLTADAGGDAEAPLEANLTSVLITSELKLAILQSTQDGASRRVRLGEVLEGTAWRLVALEPRRAVFEGPQGRRELDLRVFDGTGAAPPTPQHTRVPPARLDAPAAVAAAAAPAPAEAKPDPDASAAPITPEQQVEAIRRRIEARRAMAAEAARERATPESTSQQVE